MALRGGKMKTKLKMIYWKGEKFWVGKLLQHPEIMTQGETLEELEENMKDAYTLMTIVGGGEKELIAEEPKASPMEPAAKFEVSIFE